MMKLSYLVLSKQVLEIWSRPLVWGSVRVVVGAHACGRLSRGARMGMDGLMHVGMVESMGVW